MERSEHKFNGRTYPDSNEKIYSKFSKCFAIGVNSHKLKES